MATQKVTITDLSILSGISRSTISRVLNHNANVNPEVRKKVELAIKESGYSRKATKLKYNMPIRSVTIATMQSIDAADKFYSAMLEQFYEQFENMGLQAQLVMLHDEMDDAQILNKLIDSECILILGPELPVITTQLKAKNIPVVLVNGFDTEMKISSVSLDYELGGELAARHLINSGHRNIAMITAQTRPSIRKRTYGFERIAKELGIDNVTIIDILDFCHSNDKHALAEQIRTGKAGIDFGASKVIPKMLDQGLLQGATAVFCVCDSTALSLMDELEKRHIKVPNDLSVLGFDNLSIGMMITPSLSSIGTDHRIAAQSAIQLLIQEFNNESSIAQRINIGVKLFERDSVRYL